MPNYTYKCTSDICQRTMELVRPIAERDSPGVQCLCGHDIVRVPDAPFGKVVGGTPKFHK